MPLAEGSLQTSAKTIKDGFNEMPEVSLLELQSHEIGSQIITRAALLLMHQLGMKNEEKCPTECEKIGNSWELDDQEENTMPAISPFSMEEFRDSIRNCMGSPCTPRTRATLMAKIFSVPTNFHDNQNEFTVPTTTSVNKASRSVISEKAVPTITLTPKVSSKRSSEIMKKEEKQTGDRRESMIPPSFQPTRTPRVQNKVLGDMTPYENRASRLRRQKMEEQRRISMGSASALDTSMNSSFGWK